MLGQRLRRARPAPDPEGWVTKPDGARPQDARVGDGVDPEQRSIGHAHAAGDQGTVPEKDVRVQGDGSDGNRPAMYARPAEVDAVSTERVITNVDGSGERVD